MLPKTPTLKTSKIQLSHPKIKTVTGPLSLSDGKPNEGKIWPLHFTVGNRYRKAANYLLNHSWLWGSAYYLLGFFEHKLSVHKMMLLVHPCLTRSLVEMALSSGSWLSSGLALSGASPGSLHSGSPSFVLHVDQKGFCS